MPRRQAREQALAGGADFHPVRVVTAKPEAVAVGRRVGKGQQPRDDMQVAVAILDFQRLLPGQVVRPLVTAHAHPLDHQRRLAAGGFQQRRFVQHHALGGAPGNLSGGGLHQRTPAEFLSRQPVMHAIQADRTAGRVDPDQATCTAGPRHTVAVHHQSARCQCRKFAFGANAVQQRQPLPIPQVLVHVPEPGHPDHAGIGDPERVDPVQGAARQAFKSGQLRHPRHQPALGRQPQLILRPAAHVRDHRQRQAGRSQRQVAQHAPVQIALLHPAVFGIDPQRAAIADLHHVAITRQRRIDTAAAIPATRRPAGRVVADQRIKAADPYPAEPVLDYRLRPVVAIDAGQVVFDLASQRVQPVQRAARTGDPDAAGGRGRQCQRIGIAQRGRVIQQAREHRELAPVRRQVPQARIGAGKPESTLAVLVCTAPVRLDQPPFLRAVQRHILHVAQPHPAKARTGVQPVIAIVRILQHVQHIARGHAAPLGTPEVAIGLPHRHPFVGGYPQTVLLVDLEAVDPRRGQHSGRHPLETGSIPARQAILGPHPQAAVSRHRQIAHRRRRAGCGYRPAPA